MNVELRGYQSAALDGLRTGFASGARAQILYGPTGAGKTEMAISMMSAASAKGTRCAMILDRIVLVEQTSQRLDRYGIDHGVLQAGHWRYRPHERIQVCSAQTLEKRGSFPGLQLLIVDEAHQTRDATRKFIDAHPGVKVVGLTATPFTKGLGKTYSGLVVPTTTEALVDAGNLVPLRVFAGRQIDMTGAQKIAGEWSERDATERGVRIVGDVVSEWVARTHAIFGGPRKTIVFCAGVAHGKELAERFAEAGYNFIQVSYLDDGEFKRDAIAEFAKTDSSIHGLIATDILTKGFDVPDVMIGVSARPFSKSLSSHIQQMGRVMRSAPGKDFGLWIDHSGNYLRFADDWESIYSDGPGRLDDGRETPKTEPTDRQKIEAKCPACGAIFGPRSDTCAHCGYVRQRRSKVIAETGELVEIVGSAARGDRAEKQRLWSELLAFACDRGYQRGWASHKYRARFGCWPRNLRDDMLTPSASTIKFIRDEQAAWAKQRAA